MAGDAARRRRARGAATGQAEGQRSGDSNGVEAAAGGGMDGSASGVAGDGGEVVECRFKHLLEPIRDLALNWDIDIAQVLACSCCWRSLPRGGRAPVPFRVLLQTHLCACRFRWLTSWLQELENYLGQLEQVQVSLDGGISMLNFAEAALLIQVRSRPDHCISSCLAHARTHARTHTPCVALSTPTH